VHRVRRPSRYASALKVASLGARMPPLIAIMTLEFSYQEAFARNLGWVTAGEQATLRNKTVAIAGLGGVGGVHLLTLARLGIGGFHIADHDHFSLVNFNRQVGASMSTLGQAKTDVLAKMAADINPEMRIACFPAGVDSDNLNAFLDGVDLYVDGLDFFAFEARRQVFAACAARGIPAITVMSTFSGATCQRTNWLCVFWLGWRRRDCTGAIWSIRRGWTWLHTARHRPSWVANSQQASPPPKP
jgi:hypothetical protein